MAHNTKSDKYQNRLIIPRTLLNNQIILYCLMHKIAKKPDLPNLAWWCSQHLIKIHVSNRIAIGIFIKSHCISDVWYPLIPLHWTLPSNSFVSTALIEALYWSTTCFGAWQAHDQCPLFPHLWQMLVGGFWFWFWSWLWFLFWFILLTKLFLVVLEFCTIVRPL